MTEQVRDPTRETRFVEFDLGGTTIGLISDESNERAWIQSDRMVDVEP